MQSDTRAQALRILGEVDHPLIRTVVKVVGCSVAAFFVAHWTQGDSAGVESLSEAGRSTLWILVFAALMWVTEALPAYAVGLLVMGLEILILGRPGGVFAEDGDYKAWEQFVQPWSNPLMWLFIGGFVLAAAASKTQLDQVIARRVLRFFGHEPKAVLAGCMMVTFVFSMFMSNTATAAMMIAVVAPVALSLNAEDPFMKALYLGIPISANIGGMGTIIGSPPNAIAAGLMPTGSQVDFLQWMTYGLPPAILLAVVGWMYLVKRYPCETGSIRLLPSEELSGAEGGKYNNLHRFAVASVFVITIGLWMTESLHKIPNAVVSFIPIVSFAVFGVLKSEDIRNLQWDVLLLLCGGLSLGVAVRVSGLADWVASLLPTGLPIWAIVLVMAYLAVVQSNLMSNTATAAILLPIGIGFVPEVPLALAVPVALTCSCAMMLPISTPPNAVAFASNKVGTKDFVKSGALFTLLGPAIVYLWMVVALWLGL
ncbi:SLC13 family permease [Rubritalea tangerina]|uniref:SLC13 family permease n=1 Tax=Rubritalea tangerina TaxID=430798 RepID=A0ABW4ZAH7_9BACT